MTFVRGVNIYIGKSNAAKHASPGQNLHLDDDGFLCQQFRKSLLATRDEGEVFRARVDIPEMPPVDVKWTSVGLTAGVAFWVRNKRIGVASILVNGTECDDEREQFLKAFAAHGLVVPDLVWTMLAEQPKPVAVHVFFDLYHYTDPVIATAAPALANAFFKIFGTNTDERGPSTSA